MRDLKPFYLSSRISSSHAETRVSLRQLWRGIPQFLFSLPVRPSVHTLLVLAGSTMLPIVACTMSSQKSYSTVRSCPEAAADAESHADNAAVQTAESCLDRHRVLRRSRRRRWRSLHCCRFSGFTYRRPPLPMLIFLLLIAYLMLISSSNTHFCCCARFFAIFTPVGELYCPRDRIAFLHCRHGGRVRIATLRCTFEQCSSKC